jgi:alginate O-acetyltransferase complex protein AlgI
VLFFAYAYLDFAAYSDIAIGSSRLFGIRIIENFNFPFVARNINEFWQRWHMSLSGWCRAYVYMPTIGLTRNPYLAIYATMATIGIWHEGSLTWLCWGLYHATGIVVYGSWARFRRRRKWRLRTGLVPRLVGVGVTMLFVSGSYVFPVAGEHGGLASAVRPFAKLFGIVLSPS